MDAGMIDLEERRLAVLRDFGVLDTAPERDFDDIADLAAQICEVPVALISFVDKDRQWFKARTGLDPKETPISQSICAHVIRANTFTEISDTREDPRTADNPLVTGPEQFRFYAGALLQTAQGLPLGTLCVLDRVPRQLTDLQRRTLKVLADQIIRQLELRRALSDAEVMRREVDHRVKNSLQSIEALVRMQARQAGSPEVRAALDGVRGRLATVSGLHEALHQADAGATVNIAVFLHKVVQSVSQQLPRHVQVDVNISDLTVSSRAASALGMLVNECVTNAAKYAFRDRTDGRIDITGTQQGNSYRLVCADNGPGLGDMHGGGTGLGLRIMQASAQTLGGEMNVLDDDMGTAIEVTWPLG